MYRYLETLRLPPQTLSVQPKPAKKNMRHLSPLIPPGPLESFSAQKATGLFVRDTTTLDETEQQELLLIQLASPTAQQAYLLVQAFMQMIRERTGEQLDTWLSEVQASHIPEFDSFATGIQRDKTAVLAGLTLSWSNGPLEGNINRLKLIKRSMYGRAKFDLLRLRVLHRPKTSQEIQGAKTGTEYKQRKGNTKQLRTGENISNFEHTTFLISRVA